jgi:hypothetical protein
VGLAGQPAILVSTPTWRNVLRTRQINRADWMPDCLTPPAAETVALSHFFELRPRLPRVPALLKRRLGFIQGRHAIGAYLFRLVERETVVLDGLRFA